MGKSFEYSMLLSIYNSLRDNQEVEIVESSSLPVAQGMYEGLSTEEKECMASASNAATRVLLCLEPQLLYRGNNSQLRLSLQEDRVGQAGDVRDVLTIRISNSWEIGISCKHNHFAVKHSRLSGVLDFGESWFNTPCSQSYFAEIAPLFSELRQLKEQEVLWKDINNKAGRFYIPLLEAFIREMRSLDILYPREIPAKLVEYLIGRKDFYKVIADVKRRVTQITAFNMRGSLNCHADDNQPQTRVQLLHLPTRFLDIAFKENSNNTIQIYCDGGWAFNMRIHNASSKVEPSLKFDISLLSYPPAIYNHHESWE